jgi:hypothetical protein
MRTVGQILIRVHAKSWLLLRHHCSGKTYSSTFITNSPNFRLEVMNRLGTNLKGFFDSMISHQSLKEEQLSDIEAEL